MTGVLAAFAGSGRGVVRDPTTGDYFNTNNKVTLNTYTGANPPFSSYYETIFRWNGVDVATEIAYYPDEAIISVVVGSYTYYAGSYQGGAGGEPIVTLYGIYRVGPPA